MVKKTKRTRTGVKTTKAGGPVRAVKAKAGEAITTAKAPKKAAIPDKKAATFRLDAPYATKVFVAGSFNDWSPVATPLTRNDEGIWTGHGKSGSWRVRVSIRHGRYLVG
jgi:Carbohydrate-binding module 48 (Isoamylase N-terminal domain)